ncbi:MAG: alpha-amylase, partial [Chloroflexi bacterium]|nr:alpha-amylase [Chloroflexota bacterium]
MTRINQNSMFYHIYPLGACNAPHRSDFNGPPVSRLQKMFEWLDHIQALGTNAIYLGPVFESTTHGYDTANYYEVDRRLGTRQDLRDFALELKRRGMALVLDGVFNHVGRDFWAFKDLLAHGQSSAYKDWFDGLRFDQISPFGDPFSYEAWSGHFDLVKL